MIIAELFSPEPAENLLASLCFLPERVIFLGFRSTMTDERIADIREFFRRRRPAVRLTFLRVADRDYAGASAAFHDVLKKYPDCRFEMTGGSDLLLAALGAAAAEESISLFEMDVRSQALRVLRGDFPVKEGCIRPLRSISAAEYVRLCGGELTESSYHLSAALPDSLEKDVEDMWHVYTEDPRDWTRQCALLAALCARSRSGGLTVSAPMEEKPAPEHIRRLLERRLIRDYRTKGGIVTLTFRNQHVKRTLTRAGDLLELRVFLAARSEPGIFTDAVMGAKISWNGGEEKGGTMNEIDGLLMHGVVPFYVSCKIGSVPKEALYEVDSVASRFGGSYAAMALVCSSLSGSESARRTLRQRARDMGILLIEGVESLSPRQLTERLLREAADGPSGRLTAL